MDPITLLTAIGLVLPVVGGIFGLYVRQVTKSREAVQDRHAADLAAKDAQIAGKETELRGLTLQISGLDTRLQIAQDVREALETLRQLPPPEKRADPSLANKTYDIIPLARVVEFYDQIAAHYNRRNTGEYLNTYIEIYQTVASNISSIEEANFCDLGGGTGFLLNRFKHHSVRWVNIDISREAQRIFESDFSSYKFIDIRTLDVGRDTFTKRDEKFDVIVMNYLWSSMDGSPDFEQIMTVMHTESILVVADNMHSYVDENRYYGFDNINGKNLAIAPRPMVPSDIRTIVTSHGFEEIAFKVVSIQGKPYSQIQAFRKRA